AGPGDFVRSGPQRLPFRIDRHRLSARIPVCSSHETVSVLPTPANVTRRTLSREDAGGGHGKTRDLPPLSTHRSSDRLSAAAYPVCVRPVRDPEGPALGGEGRR